MVILNIYAKRHTFPLKKNIFSLHLQKTQHTKHDKNETKNKSHGK